ncbi:MAG: hypothetical protein M1822_006014 [Bathelium mastoideum]|nr:MAG: hypothetical protein M1822_006014 [Bathelium mastoideum]
MFGIQIWFPIENSTLIVSATIPTLRPLISRLRASKTLLHTGNKQEAYQRSKGTRRNTEDPTGSGSIGGSSDQVELTGVSREILGTSTDIECVTVADGYSREAGTHQQPPPKTGIMKTMNAYVTY